MIAIHIGSKRNTAKAHLAKPVELAVKCELLKNAENSDEKAEEHNEPDETAPIVRRAEQLRGEKQKKSVGDQELKIEPGIVKRDRAPKNYLP